MKIKDFIGKLTHEKGTQRVLDTSGNIKFEIDSAGNIKKYLGYNNLNLNMKKVYQFQDKYIQFIVDAINEKLEREGK